MAAMIFKVPPHCGHCSMSISNTRLSNRAQLRRTGAEAGGASAWSAEGVLALTGALGMPGPRAARDVACLVPRGSNDLGTQLGIGREDAMEADEMQPWTGDKRGQALH